MTEPHQQAPSPLSQQHGTPEELRATVAATTDALRSATPLVQCLTNQVVMQFTANLLLAAGATPAMCDTPNEAGPFARIAGATLINAGTPSAEQYEGMRAAIAAADLWVLDPVAAGGLAERTQFYEWALRQGPTAIRGNASEILALTGGKGGRGVDATDSVEDARAAAQELSVSTGAVVAVSGATDLIVHGNRAVSVSGGHPMLQQVIGTGCGLGALVAAYLAIEDDPLIATAAAHAHLKAAAEAANPLGPGTFAVTLLDALAHTGATAALEAH